MYIYIYIYIYKANGHALASPMEMPRAVGDFKDTVCPCFESDTLFLECVCCVVFDSLAILRIEVCLSSTL